MNSNIEKTLKEKETEEFMEAVLMFRQWFKEEEITDETIWNLDLMMGRFASRFVIEKNKALNNKEKEVVLRIREGVKGIGFSVAHNDYFERGTKEMRNAVLEILETK